MRRKVNGLTLIELLAAVGIVGVTLGFGLPAFSGIRERTQATNAFYLLTSSLMIARSSAVSRHETVSMCPSNDGVTCRNDALWEDGWIVFLDKGKTGQPKDAAAVIRKLDGLGNDLTVRSSAGRLQVRYQSDGRSSGTNVSLRICSRRRGTLLGSVVVNNSGRARSEQNSSPRPTCPYAI